MLLLAFFLAIMGCTALFIIYRQRFCLQTRPPEEHAGSTPTQMLWSTGPLLGLTAGVTVSMQLFFFFVAYTCQFDKVTDAAGASNFLLLAWLGYGLASQSYTRQLVNTILITVWALRLGIYLLARVLKRGHDARFDEMRSQFFVFLGFWIFQMLWVWLVSLPVIFLNAATKDVALGARDYAGWILWGVGFLFEVAADASKDNFMNNSQNRGKIIMSGVWSCTRHPNYFGEITLWLGLFISCTSVFGPNDIPGAYVSVLSPLFTFAILMFGSGITLAEERYNKRHGKDEWYLDYRERTSPLLPFPPALYRILPQWVKTAFFFEYALYARGLPEHSHILPTDTSPPTSNTNSS